MQPCTVKELLNACQKSMDNGNGDRYIFIAGDEEGNYFHPLLFLFSQCEEGCNIEYYGNINKENSILLG